MLVRLGLKKKRLPNGHPELVRRIRILLRSSMFVQDIVTQLEFLSEATLEEFQKYELTLKK